MERQKGSESLREAVRRLDQRLWHQLQEIWRLAEEGIHDAQISRDGHQQGTPHCLAVEENLSALIPDDWKGTRFTAADLFVLSAAAALHDVGKAGDLVDDHGHISMYELRGRSSTFGLDNGQAVVIGWIVRAHNDGDLVALPSQPIPLGTAEVNVRQLAALFKLADSLHTDYSRVSRQVVEFGGRLAEGDPKTCFRLRVTGWRFDDEGRVELYAVPKDWDDVGVIRTGLEIMRGELEPVVPTLRDAGLPCRLTISIEDTNLEHKAEKEIKAKRRIQRAFVGMDYFTEADAAHFKGRDDIADELWHLVMAIPVTLLVGESGVGKTSLIHAGLFPRLHQIPWHTVYARPFDDPDRIIVRALWRELLEGEPPDGAAIVEAFGRVAQAVGERKILVVLDQFEDVRRVPLPENLDGMRKALVAVQAGRFHNLRLLISYRADAEAVLGPLFQEAAGSSRGFQRVYLQPLSRAGARAGLEAGFLQAQVAVEGGLLDIIAGELEDQTVTPGVYPPYVQMVGETLREAAGEENEFILTGELYRDRGGCTDIIGRYLLQRLADFGEQQDVARRVLVTLVRSTGVKGQESLEELRAGTGLDSERFAPLLRELVNKRMIRHLGGERYEIVHDHLALLVSREILGPEERQLKELREFLSLKARAYLTSHIPLQSSDMAQLYAAREKISPNDDEMRLLLHSCLLERGSAWFWLRGSGSTSAHFLQEALTSPIGALRLTAVPYLAGCMGRQAVPDLQRILKDGDSRVRQKAEQALVQVVGRGDMPRLQEMLGEDRATRRAAARAIAEIASEATLSILQRLLGDEDPRVQETAIVALKRVAPREIIPSLCRLLSSEDWGVRAVAGRALPQVLQHATSDNIPHLRELLGGSDEIKEVAVGALAKVAGREAIPDLQRILRRGHLGVRKAAMRALAQAVGPEGAPELRGLLKHGHRNVREAAACALIEIVGDDGLPDLRRLVKDRAWRVRRAAVEALGQLAVHETISDLRGALSDKNAHVRRAAVEALFGLVGREAIPDLQAMLEDQNKQVRATVRKRLGDAMRRAHLVDIPWLEELRSQDSAAAVAGFTHAVAQAGQEAVPVLESLANGKNAWLREMARRAQPWTMLQMGKRAIPELLEMLGDENWKVRDEAVKVLEQIVEQWAGEIIPELRMMVGDGSRRVRELAIKALERADRSLAASELQEMTKSEYPDVRLASVGMLVRYAGPLAASELRGLLNDEHIPVRLEAAQGLAQIAGREALSDLRELLASSDAAVRRMVWRDLLPGVLEQAEECDIPDLLELLDVALDVLSGPRYEYPKGGRIYDRHRAVLPVARAIPYVLARLAGGRALPTLRELLKSKDDDVRVAAIESLARGVGREAIPDLRDMLGSGSARVNEALSKELAELVTEQDIAWLCEWVVRYQLTPVGEIARDVLTHLDRELYCPFPVPAESGSESDSRLLSHEIMRVLGL